MKVTFIYRPLGEATGGTTIRLSLGDRLSPMEQSWQYSAVAQAVQFPRAAAQKFIARGGASVSESFTAVKEHARFWESLIYTRVEVGALMGKNGTLIFQDDSAGSIALQDAVCQSAGGGRIIGMASFVAFSFTGGIWVRT